ncbi:MAG: zinc-ribbon domain-containing protein, partial [Frankiales bacterium]|nr:zinc-ribbon domain-containing protein [Frankiales bacterium]
MFCTQCGQQNPDDSRFCARCGAPLTIPGAPPGAAGGAEQTTT